MTAGPPRVTRFGLAVVAAVVATVVFAAWLRGLWGGEATVLWMENLALTFVPLAAGVACLLRARASDSHVRRGWLLLGLGVASWGIASGIITLQTSVFQRGVPPSEWVIDIPGPADFFFLAFFPLAAAGLISLVGEAGQSRLRVVLDALIVVLSLLFIAWTSGLGENYDSWGGEAIRTDLCSATEPYCDQVGFLVGVLNPLGDLVLASLALLLVTFSPRVPRRTFLLLAAGLLLITVADVEFSTRWLREDQAVGNLPDTGWIAGFSLVGLAAVRSPRALSEQVRRPLLLAVLPFLPFAVATLVALGEYLRAGTLEPLLFYLSFIVVALVFLRQFLMLAENLALTRRVEAAYSDLQEQQRLRTTTINAITHDLLSPMTPVRLQLHLLAGPLGELNDRQRNAVDVIGRNVGRVVHLAGDLKDMANIEIGHFRMELAPVDLAALATASARSFADGAAARGVTMTADAPETLAVQGDATRLGQVLDNLAGNACKFTPSGGTVTLRVRRDGVKARVEVQDTGRGLTREETERLFRPFSQVHDRATQRPEDRGTGLGLFISRGIVEQHGGKMGVHSEGLGKGATFWFEVPAS